MRFQSFKKTGKSHPMRIVAVLAGLGMIAALFYGLWDAGAFLPGWIAWEEDHNFGGAGGYEISLADRALCVRYDGERIWNSPENVKVQQVLSCDIDRDDAEELILLCWKKGRFGKYRPFWVEEDEKGWSQHLFVYEYGEREITPKWMSSYLGQDVLSMGTAQNKSGEKWLLLTDKKGAASSWRWGSWGFSKEDTEVSFILFGDNLIHEPIYTYGLNHNGNFDFLYEHVRKRIDESDIAVINQETPLVENASEYGDYPRFGTPIQVGEAMADAGFDAVACATNHALDRGEKGIRTTKEFFSSRGILCLGIQTSEESENKPYEIMKRKGASFALFNYTYGTNGNSLPEGYPYTVHLLKEEAQIREDLKKAREEADFVIVIVHWGTEQETEPDLLQKEWTNVFLESKVDVVIGSHSHTVQPFEMLDGTDGHRMLVYYSLGNFVSAQQEKSCGKGAAAVFTAVPGADGYEVSNYDLKPLTILWQEGGGYTTVFTGEH